MMFLSSADLIINIQFEIAAHNQYVKGDPLNKDDSEDINKENFNNAASG